MEYSTQEAEVLVVIKKWKDWALEDLGTCA